MEKIKSFYIADGHHRSASTELFNQKVTTLQNDKSMCFLLHEDQLEIKPFHRLIKPTFRMNRQDIVEVLLEDFNVSKSDKPLFDVANKNEFGLLIDNQWYLLHYKSASHMLDVEIIEEYIVKKVFKIKDSRVDSQITFLPYSEGLDALNSLMDRQIYRVAITSKACEFEEIRMVSDQNRKLPPKSTYIEPKLRSGMIIQEFSPTNSN